jgi:hypothetical protein
MIVFRHKLLTREGRVLANGYSSIIRDNICKIIHKKCHPNSYYNDIKYHTTLNFIFSVVADELVQFGN